MINFIRKYKKLLVASLFTIVSPFVYAQSAENQKQELMLKDGKIYVVIAVVVTILIGLFVYVWSLDRKIRKMEEEN